MIDWKLGGRAGSIRKWARQEVRSQLRNNPVSQKERYRYGVKILHQLLGRRTFGTLIGIYLLLDIAVGFSEIIYAKICNEPPQSSLHVRGALEAIQSQSGNLLTVQIGVLSITSLALALVTLIAQRDNSSADIRVYYHESLAFELVASGVALLVVLVSQYYWPLQTMVHRLDFGAEVPIFEAILLGAHCIWLLVNLLGTAHFVATTLHFTQPAQREKIRRRYTANVLQPHDLTKRLEEHLYTSEIRNILSNDDTFGTKCYAYFGLGSGIQSNIEIRKKISKPIKLHDVKVVWVHWVLLRWEKRCQKETHLPSSSMMPTIWFTPRLGQTVSEDIDWCQRSEGVPLTTLEVFILKRAFRFKKVSKYG